MIWTHGEVMLKVKYVDRRQEGILKETEGEADLGREMRWLKVEGESGRACRMFERERDETQGS